MSFTPAHSGLVSTADVSERPRGEVVRFGGRHGAGPVHLDADRVLLLGAWLATAPVLMLFLSLASAYIVRSGLPPDWAPVPMPPLFWVNTGLLLASSALLEAGRRGRGRAPVLAAAGLGLAFLAGQVVAWRQMIAAGIGLGATPYASFLYVLSGTHLVHALIGVGALVAAGAWPAAGRMRVGRGAVVGAASIYWHFLDSVWLGLFAMLVFWR